MTEVGAPQAWDITQGSSDVVVAVIDTGIDINHQELAANIWTNPAPGSVTGITGDINGYNFFDDDGKVLIDFEGGDIYAIGLALQADGKIVLAGYADQGGATGSTSRRHGWM